jgi:hypothetical protein
MAQIGEAHPVDAGRQAAFPATPDQPRHIEQKGRVAGQADKWEQGKDKTMIKSAALSKKCSSRQRQAFGSRTIRSGPML